MKKVLILGTSHSAASCKRNTEIKRLLSGRYHDYFKTEWGWEVTNLSMPGITPQGQLLALTAYLADNPNAHWDLVLFEGRNIENTINIPWPHESAAEITDWNNFYHLFEDKEVYDKTLKQPFECKSITSNSVDKQYSELFGWGVPYVGSINQAVDTYGCNRAIISILEQHCDIVKFWVMSNIPKFDVSDEYYWHRQLAQQLLGKWLLFDKIDHQIIIPDHERCKCNHANAQGHLRIWNEHIKPAVLKLVDNV